MTKLSKHLSDTNQTYREFAKKVPMSVSFLSEILSEDSKKRKSPSLSLALKIQDATGNAVRLSDWPKLAEVHRVFESSLRSSSET